MRWATILAVAAGVTAAANSSASAQMAFPSSDTAAHEVLIEVANSANRQAVGALLRRHRLTGLDAHTSKLAGTTIYRGRFGDRRSVAAVVRSLKREAAVAAAQPNYAYRQAAKIPARQRTPQIAR